VALRERVAIPPEQVPEALRDARSRLELSEAVILSTCNRTELVASGNGQRAESGIDWLSSFHHVPLQDIEPHAYCLRDDDALRHLMQVASGLDSMVLGEPQIFGQMKSAFAQAGNAGSVSGELSRVFNHTFAIAQRIRTDTAICEHPVSVAYAAVRLARHIFAQLEDTSALLIGAGETIELVARHLRECGIRQLTVANRSLERAAALVERFDAEAVLLSEIPERLAAADIVISSTASQLPILGKGTVEQAVRRRRRRPIFMVDIAVPRDIEPQVGDLNDVYLYTIDDLQEIIADNRRARESEARKADQIITEGVELFRRERRSLDAVDTLRAYRSHAETLREAELERALRALEGGADPRELLQRLSRNLTNKLLHNPSVQMRQAAADGRQDLLQIADELLVPRPADDDA
jgi:glutamyl-tRNA reductase